MSDRTEGFALMVHVPAEEWAYAKRRLVYLEAALLQLLKDRERIQEWYDAAELADLGLAGLPTSKAGITRTANAGSWLRRSVTGRGGMRYEYHYSSFPARTFDDLIGRILEVSQPDEDPVVPQAPEIAPAPMPARSEPPNMEPPWVLPFMRLLKGGAKGSLTAAWRALPENIPPGVQLPSPEEAADTIFRLGLMK